MSRLRLSGLVRPQMDPSPVVARIKTQPASRLTYRSRVSTPANPVPTARSFVPSLPRRDSVRSFDESRHASRLPVRSPSPTSIPSSSRPTPVRSFRRSAILEERQAARQARPRPWLTERSSLSTRRQPSSRPSTTSASPDKKVQFGSRKTVIPVTRWIDQEKHVFKPLIRYRCRDHRHVDAHHARSKARFDKAGKPVKHVRFGETTEVSVTRWIDRLLHTHPEPIHAANQKLQGWRVIPLLKPRANGEEVRYKTYWGSDPYAMLTVHLDSPCDHGHDCSYWCLARIQAKHPTWAPKVVFQAWLHKRESIRRKGLFMP
ncbi:hypothetical protein BJX61DRAFT_536850 [Aspergillus egyptiacus]|nr:hypothetical protein BJX61DRAFT_536850 [Aspergillus egyptiacus]